MKDTNYNKKASSISSIFNEKGQLFGKVNIIDIVVLVVLVFGIYSAYDISKDFIKSKESDKITFSLTATQVKPFIAENIRKDDKVSVLKTKSYMGDVSTVTLKDSIAYTTNKEGENIQTIMPDTYALEVLVNATGKFDGTTAKIGDGSYGVGDVFKFCVGNAVLDLEIKKIENVK